MTDARRRLVLAVVSITSLMLAVDNLILNVALPTMARELHASTSELQWIVDAYVVVFAGLLLVGGSLGDRFGRARMLRLGLVVFGLASLVAAESSDAMALTVCRGAMGVGAALAMPASMAVLTNVFTDPKERARALGIWSALAGVGLALGPVLGGVLLSQFWWGSVFLVNVPVVVIALVVGWRVVPESRDPVGSQIDAVGLVLSVLGVTGLVWVTIEAPSHGWTSPTTLVSFVVAGLLLAGFVLWELHCDHPMLELHVFRLRRFSAANVCTVAVQFGYAGTMFGLTQLLQSVLGYSPLAASMRLVPLAVSFTVGGLAAPRLAEWVGTKRAVAIGSITFAAGLVVLVPIDAQVGLAPIAVATVLIGVGAGFTIPPIADAAMGAVPRQKAGTAAGTLNTTKQVSTALGVAVLGSLLVSGYRSSLTGATSALGLSARDLSASQQSVDAALQVGRRLDPVTGRALSDAARDAFVDGMRVGSIVGAAMLVLGAVLALRFLPAHADRVPGGDIEEMELLLG